MSSADRIQHSANKPKALSTSIKRGAANIEEFARSAWSFVKQNSTLPEQVVTFFGAAWRCLSSTVTCWHFRNTRCHSVAHFRRNAPHRAKRRQATTADATKRQPAPSCDDARRKAPRSVTRQVVHPSVGSRSRSSRKWSVTGSRNFSGGKTDNKEWPERLAQANLRAHRAPCGSTRTSEATDSTIDVNTSGSPHPSGTRLRS